MENNLNFKKNLSQSLYFVRGIAIILVVIGHVIGDRDNGVLQLQPLPVLFLERFNQFIYLFHVPLFFITSGIAFAFFSKRTTNCLSFTRTRFQKLFIPVLAWTPIYFLLKSLSDKSQPFSFLNLIKLLNPIYPFLHFWFLETLLFISLLSFAILKLIGFDFKKYLWIAIALFGLSLFFREIDLGNYLAVQLYWNIVYAFGLFIAHHLEAIASHFKHSSASFRRLLVVFMITLMIEIDVVIPSHSFFHGAAIFERTAISCLAFFAIYFAYLEIFGYTESSINWHGRILTLVKRSLIYVGSMSMVIYLLHVLFTAGVRILLIKLFATTDLSLHFVLEAIAGTLGSIAIYQLFRQNKLFIYLIGSSATVAKA